MKKFNFGCVNVVTFLFTEEIYYNKCLNLKNSCF